MPFFNHAIGSPRFQVAGLPALSPTPGTSLKLPFTTVITDASGYWDAVNFRWVPKVAGWYNCSLVARFTSAASTVSAILTTQLFQNGAVVNANANMITLTAQSLSQGIFVESLIKFNGSTDFLEGNGLLGVALTGAWVTPSFNTSVAGNYLQAFYVGP
jgi:hypothetical protein